MTIVPRIRDDDPIARLLRNGRPGEALRRTRCGLGSAQPATARAAELHHLAARCLEALGRPQEAAEHDARAADCMLAALFREQWRRLPRRPAWWGAAP